MAKSETVIRELCELADVQINGSRPWDMQVHDQRLYNRILRDSSLGLGEAYIKGWWDCESLDGFICRVLTPPGRKDPK